MVFGFFAVVGKRDVHAFFRQHHRGCRRQINTFVGGTEQHIESDAAFNDGLCIEFCQLQRGQAVVKEASIEEIVRPPSGFGGEFAEFQNILGEERLRSS